MNAKLAATSGENFSMLEIFPVVFSIGRIIFEKKTSRVAIIIDEKIIVSSDLNRYPINIPIAINAEIAPTPIINS